MSKYGLLILNTDRTTQVIERDSSQMFYGDLVKILECRCIEPIATRYKGIYLIADEDGRLKDLQKNEQASVLSRRIPTDKQLDYLLEKVFGINRRQSDNNLWGKMIVAAIVQTPDGKKEFNLLTLEDIEKLQRSLSLLMAQLSDAQEQLYLKIQEIISTKACDRQTDEINSTDTVNDNKGEQQHENIE